MGGHPVIEGPLEEAAGVVVPGVFPRGLATLAAFAPNHSIAERYRPRRCYAYFPGLPATGGIRLQLQLGGSILPLNERCIDERQRRMREACTPAFLREG